MRFNNNIPKTFSLYITKNKKSGYLRIKSSQKNFGDIIYRIVLVKNISEASKFINYDNLKKEALVIKEKYKLEDISIIDDKTGKVYHVKPKKEQ